MSWLAIIKSRAARYVALALALAWAALRFRQGGAKDTLRDIKEKDHENADTIRRGVERDLDQRMRKYEGRGFRDE
jgi:hypothetical protein